MLVIYISSLEKCLFGSSTHFLIRLFDFLMFSFTNCLCMLDINPLSIVSFADIFSHSVGCLFILSMVSFAVQKLLSLIRSHLFIFAFIFFTWEDRSKKILLRFMSKRVLPIFSSRSFIVSGLTFRSLIHFEIIFVYDVRECSNIILLYVAVQFSQHYLLKRLSFLHCIFLPPLVWKKCYLVIFRIYSWEITLSSGLEFWLREEAEGGGWKEASSSLLWKLLFVKT